MWLGRGDEEKETFSLAFFSSAAMSAAMVAAELPSARSLE